MHKTKVAATATVLTALMLAALLLSASSGGGFAAVAKKDSAPAGLVINEVMADNDAAVAGPQGTFPDWIELYNGSNDTVKLDGMYLTNDLSSPKVWEFPENTTIAAGSFLIVWMDGARLDDGELHASFALNANAASMGLFGSDGETLIDSVSLSKQLRDISYGRIPDGGSNWQYLTNATPDAPNQPNLPNAPLSNWAALTIAVLAIVLIAAMFLSLKRNQKRRLYEYKQ
jgi:hypothetical protein